MDHDHLNNEPAESRRQPIEASWLEQLDACRPHSGDLDSPEMCALVAELQRDPELRSAYDRIQKLDDAIVDAMDDVPVPSGLAERLLTRLASDAEKIAVDTPPAIDTPPAPVHRRTRRAWLIGSGSAALALAASLLAALFLWPTASPDLGPEGIVQAALSLHEQDHETWGKLIVDRPAPAEYPLGRYLLASPRSPWRSLNGFLGRNGVAYELTGPRHIRGTLFVVDWAAR
jgi:hypothetical protein